MMSTNYMLGLCGAVAVIIGASPARSEDMSTAQAAAAFGARERVIDASLSPDGSKVAVVVPGPKQSTIVQVIDVRNGTAKPINYANGDPMILTGCDWASNTRLVCSLYGVSDREGSYEGYSRMIGLDADGSNVKPLGVMQAIQDYVSRSDGYVIDWRDGTSDSVLIARNYVPLKSNIITVGSKAQGLGVDLLDTRTGKADHIESPDPIVGRYVSDGNGKVRMKQQYESFKFGNRYSGIATFYYRLPGNDDWKPFSKYSEVDESGMYPLAVDGTANVAYVLEQSGNTKALFRVALDGSMKKELAVSDPIVDIRGVVTVGRHGRAIGASLTREVSEVRYFDPTYEKLVTSLSKALKLPLITVIGSSVDEKVHLIHAASDVDPGRYFVYDGIRKSLTPLLSDRPELSGLAIGDMKPITYKAADGTAIPAYLTLPPGKSGKGLPAIVMPHGGPASRDVWGFDWLVQFYANRGYAVIQPNYRGSSGYGQDWFKDNGFRSWKIAINDVLDAGRWLVSEGIADPNKLAIVGWSYGGYAALQSQVVDPGLFKAVVAIAPVTDLGALRSEIGGGNQIAQDYIGEGTQLQEGSPARHADRFTAPVMLFHGSKDINVSFNQSKAMDKQLRSAGKSSNLIVYPVIDHQLRDSDVRIDMLSKSDEFLRKSLKL